MIDCFLLSFDFVVEVSSASFFCSNSDALGFDESEKGIFGSLKNITHLPPGLPKEGNRVADFAAGTAENLVTEEASKESPAAGTGEWLDLIDWIFRRAFADVFCTFSDKQSEDRPKSPSAAANVDLIPLETPHQEVEKPVGESTAVVRGILGCHSALVVSDLLYFSTFVVFVEYSDDFVLLIGSGQTSR